MGFIRGEISSEIEALVAVDDEDVLALGLAVCYEFGDAGVVVVDILVFFGVAVWWEG